jgi:putative aldouronate transport system substrate-binding protein
MRKFSSRSRNLVKMVSVVCAVSLLAGCGGAAGSGTTTAAVAKTTAAAAKTTTSAGSSKAAPATAAAGTTGAAAGTSKAVSDSKSLLCSDKPLELTAHIHNANSEVLNDTWRIEKKAAELTNISLKGTASVNETDSQKAFNLMIAGKVLPDIVGGNSNDLIKYGMEGAFIPLEDLIKKYAPNIQKLLDEKPEVKAALTSSDGHIYYLSTLEDSQVSQTWFIRQDWLDKLGLPVPTTVKELHDTLVAFRDKDPNGNGKKDEIGFLNRNVLANDLTGGLTSLFSLYGVNTTFYVDNGKVQLGTYTPQFKDAMKNVSQWYAEGLIDPEIFTRGGNSRDVLFAANNGGLVHDWYPSTSAYNNKMKSQVPGFKLVGILPPKDINGDQWEMESRQTVTGLGTAISSANKHPIETIKYLNFWFTPEGERLMTYGIEGDTYEMKDGKPVYTDKVMKDEKPINVYIKSIGGQQYQLAHTNLSEYENFMMTKEGVDVLALYKSSGVVNKKYPKLPALSFSEQEMNTIQTKWSVVSTYIREQMQKWTFDGSTIDSGFDKYMSDIKAMGMDDILAAYQSAYDRSKK